MCSRAITGSVWFLRNSRRNGKARGWAGQHGRQPWTTAAAGRRVENQAQELGRDSEQVGLPAGLPCKSASLCPVLPLTPWRCCLPWEHPSISSCGHLSTSEPVGRGPQQRQRSLSSSLSSRLCRYTFHFVHAPDSFVFSSFHSIFIAFNVAFISVMLLFTFHFSSWTLLICMPFFPLQTVTSIRIWKALQIGAHELLFLWVEKGQTLTISYSSNWYLSGFPIVFGSFLLTCMFFIYSQLLVSLFFWSLLPHIYPSHTMILHWFPFIKIIKCMWMRLITHWRIM